MCIGLPMQVVAPGPNAAWCEGGGECRQVDMSLVGEQVHGTWVMVFLDTAREVIDAARAAQVTAALAALEAALRGENVDRYFPDLVDREPQLPDFLRPATGGGR